MYIAGVVDSVICPLCRQITQKRHEHLDKNRFILEYLSLFDSHEDNTNVFNTNVEVIFPMEISQDRYQ